MLMEEAVRFGAAPAKDFWVFEISREQIDQNEAPQILYKVDRNISKKSLRVNFLGEGGTSGIVDFGAGKRDLFVSGSKALFESNTVFTRQENTDFYWLRKGAQTELVKQAGFFLGMAVLNCVEITLPLPVAFLSKLCHGKSVFNLEDLRKVDQSLYTVVKGFIDDPLSVTEEILGIEVYFTIQLGESVIPVCKGGEEIKLTPDSVSSYSRDVINYMMNDHTKTEFDAFVPEFPAS